MKYWINSNSGDYILLNNSGKYILYLITRFVDGKYLPMEIIELTDSQFLMIKGFVPIKAKKLFNNDRKRKVYAPTISGGNKGESKRIEVPTKSEFRDKILKELGIS